VYEPSHPAVASNFEYYIASDHSDEITVDLCSIFIHFSSEIAIYVELATVHRKVILHTYMHILFKHNRAMQFI